MRIFSTGIQAAKAVKNVGRLRYILGVFAKHGLQTFFMRMGLERYVSESQAAGMENLTLPERLRLSFEQLGPTFIKLGQLLANRPDMLPDEYIEEFKKLQDDVNPLPYEVVKKQVEQELEAPLSECFARFNELPLASASIGQVHEAVLKTGEIVVVKVQRPGIAEVIKSDINILTFLAKLLEKYVPETAFLSPTSIVDEFFKTLNYELNFVVEANTMTKVADNLKHHTRIVVPRVYRAYSTERVLTMERLNGVRITDVAELERLEINAKELAVIGVKAFFQMVLIDGLFHGDLHGGNLFALKDPVTGESKVGDRKSVV